MGRSLASALFALVFASYMLTYSRAFDIVADEGTMFAVTESIVKLGRASIDQGNHLQYLHWATIGLDGSHYSKYGLGQSLAAVPLYALALATPALGLIDVVLLLNPLAGALAAAVLMLAALELGASRQRALAVVLIYAFCTTAWVYAKNYYSEPLAGLGFALSCWGIAIMLMRRQSAGAALAGAGVGLAVLVRSSAIMVAPVLLLVTLRYGGARRWRFTWAALAPVMMAVTVVGLYNWGRFGDPLHSGYGSETFSVYPWVGAWGMLFAPGRSLFIYAPIMLAAVPGLRALRQPAGLRVWLAGATLAMLLLHGAWWSWWGAWAWGPRYLVPVLPLLALGLLGILPPCGKVDMRNRVKATLVGLLAGLSFLVQLPGVLVYRTHFFWQVMQVLPDADPDEASLYTFQFFMPLTNLRQALRGNLDLAWKPGLHAPVNIVGLLLAVLGLLIGVVGLRLAWRGRRMGRVAALVSPLVVLGVALGSLAYYQWNDGNPFRSLGAVVEECVSPEAIIFVGDDNLQTNQQIWNVNRSIRRMIGVPSDIGQMQLHTLPIVQRAVQAGQPVWYLQTEETPPVAFLTELANMGLCGTTWPVEASTRLVRWSRCDQ